MIRTTTFILTSIFMALVPTDVSANTASPNSIFGSWIIGKTHYCPAICAMNDAQAQKYRGRKLVYSETKFSNGELVCLSPRYATRVLTKKQFFAHFRFFPKDIGLNGNNIVEVSITCSDSHVNSPTIGGLVLFSSPTSVVTLWDGVYFKAHPIGGVGDSKPNTALHLTAPDGASGELGRWATR